MGQPSQPSSQISLFGTFGYISGAMYSPDAGTTKQQFGYGGGFNYTYFFKPTFGLTFGAEVLTFGNKFQLTEFPIGDDPAIDDEGESFRLRYQLKNYTETQDVMSLLIPVMLTFETKGRVLKFFLSAGAKLNITLKSAYTGMAEEIMTMGFYEQYNLNLPATMGDNALKWLGFGTFNNVQGKGKLPLRQISPVFSAELGFKLMLSRSWALYIGGYIDYGIGIFTKPDLSQAFAKYNPSSVQDYKMNTILYSQRGGNNVFVDELSMMSTGVKLKLAFNSDVIITKAAPKSADFDLLSENSKETTPPPAPAPPLTNEAPPAVVKEQVQKGEEDNIPLIIKRIVPFTMKSAELNAAAKKNLDEKARVMEKNPDVKITIRGHANDYFDKKTDTDPKLKKNAEKQNKKLSKERAAAIKKYLTEKGISGTRIKTSARGSKSPRVPDTTPRNRAKNRRADFVMGGKAK
jgi:outer membrane protein OmpA-like peptidoglycan-associated protein